LELYSGPNRGIRGVAVARDGFEHKSGGAQSLNAKNPDGTYVIPSPQTSSSGVNYTSVVPGRYNEDQFNTNSDFNLRTSDRLSAKFFFSNSNQDVPFFGASVPGFPVLRSFENPEFGNRRDSHFLAASDQPIPLWVLSSRGSKRCRRDAHRSGCGINRFTDPDEGIIPQIEVLGAFELGNSAQDRGKTAGNNFYISDVIFLSRASITFEWAQKSSEISSTI